MCILLGTSDMSTLASIIKLVVLLLFFVCFYLVFYCFSYIKISEGNFF